MVFKAVESGVMSELTTQSIRQIIAAGFMVRVYFGASGHEVFCEMRAPMERLKEFADKVCYQHLEKSASWPSVLRQTYFIRLRASWLHTAAAVVDVGVSAVDWSYPPVD